MITKKEMSELRVHIESAKNPIFYYDNDADGLCSFLLLRRTLGVGKGVAVRSYPEIDASYLRHAKKEGADYIFVLDKPVLSNAFVNAVNEIGVPLIWIDHHKQGVKYDYSGLHIFNSAESGKGEPVSAIVFETLGGKKDAWIALAGCVSDCFVPDFIDDIKRECPDLFLRGKKSAFDILYGTEFGKIARAMNYGLKDSASNVEKMQNFLISCVSPDEVLVEKNENESMRKKYSELSKKQEFLVGEAEKNAMEKLIFFIYSGETSMSSDIANELAYRNKGKYIVVGFRKGILTNLSLRGKGVKKIFEKVIVGFEGSTGGGHEDAVGARILSKDIELFREKFLEEIG